MARQVAAVHYCTAAPLFARAIETEDGATLQIEVDMLALGEREQMLPRDLFNSTDTR
jgi:hypothetical protein